MAEHPKITRIENRELLDFIMTLPCIACGKRATSEVLNDPDHITTRGAGGGDTAINVWPLCREHHNERHNKGLLYMWTTYPGCKDWLVRAERFDILGEEK